MTLAQDVKYFLLCFIVDSLDEQGHSYKVIFGDFLCYFCVVFGSIFRPHGCDATTSCQRHNLKGREGF